jgi:hypothetical protein
MEYDVVMVIFVGCTAVAAVVGNIVVGWIVGDNDGCADIKVVEVTVGLIDGATTLVCRLVGEMLGKLVDMIVGCAVLVDGLEVGRIVGVAVVGVIVGFVVIIDGLAVGRIVGATVVSATVGEAVGSRRIVGAIVGIFVFGCAAEYVGGDSITSIVLTTFAMALSVKLHTRFIYNDSSSSIVLSTETTDRWALSPTQQRLLSDIVLSNSKREHMQASV